jgi:UDP-glucose 4-epimerase
MNNLNVLITGSTGFVGKHLVNKLVSNGISTSVLLIKNKHESIHFPEAVKRYYVTSLDSIDTHLSLCTVDVVIHLAARVHIFNNNSENQYNEFYEVNVKATIKLASQAAAAGVKKFIFLSSIGVNGSKTTTKPFSSCDIPAPHNLYSLSKCEAEFSLSELFLDSSMHVIIIRAPLIYGPNNPGNMHSLVKLIKLRLPLPFLSIKNVRSYIYIGNLVDFIIHCFNINFKLPNIFLVSDGEDLSTPKFIEKICVAFNLKMIIFRFPIFILSFIARLFKFDKRFHQLTDSLQVSNLETESITGWKPPYSMDEGLRELAFWYDNKRN